MKKIGVLIIVVLLFSILVGCSNAEVQTEAETPNGDIVEQTEENTKQETIEFKRLENVFGFADESGKRLITIPNENGDKLSDPETFDLALGNNGQMLDIRFAERQEANSLDNYRQSMYNFDNMAGYIYEVIEGEFIPNKAYLLTKASVVDNSTLIGLKPAKAAEADTDTIKKVEAIKSRKITKSSLLSETIDNAKICIFVFERQADDMLASIAYIKDDKVVFKDYPAKYDEMSTWRVDAGDEPGLFEVLFLADSDEGLLLGLTWAAPEGENDFVLKESNGVFEETALSVGRYWSP